MPKSETEELGKVLSGGIYRIPNYQRGYAWTSREVNEFLDDLEYVADNPSIESHYVNSIIVAPDEERIIEQHHVIDGQQRLLTSCLVANELMRRAMNIDAGDDPDLNDSKKIIRSILYGYIFKSDGENTRYRILPADEHSEVFKDLVTEEFEEERDWEAIEKKAESPSEQKLVQATRVINNRLDNFLREEQEVRERLNPLRRLARTLHKSFQATLHEVGNPSEAGRIFEAINDRGRSLNRADQIKSYLVYRASLGDVDMNIDNIHETFTRVYEMLNEYVSSPGQVDSLVDRLIGHHWTMFAGEDKIESSDSLVGRHEEAKEDIDQIKFAKYHAPKGVDEARVAEWIDAYCRSLIDAAEAYVEFLGVGDPSLYKRLEKKLSSEVDNESIRNCLYAIERFGYSTTHSLSMALHIRFVGTEHYEPILRSLEKLVLRMFGIGGARRDTKRNDFESLARVLFWSGRDDLTSVFPEDSSIPNGVESDQEEYGITGESEDADRLVELFEKWAYNYSFEGSGEDEKDTFKERLATQHLDGLGVAGWGGIRESELKNYMLYRYEVEIKSGGMKIKSYLGDGLNDFTVEHVWPQTYDDLEYPEDLDENGYKQYVERLGNLALLLKGENSSANNAEYEIKWDRVYEDARDGTKMVREEFPIPSSRRKNGMEGNAATQKGFDTWSTAVIEWRSQRMAETLANYWGFDDKE